MVFGLNLMDLTSDLIINWTKKNGAYPNLYNDLLYYKFLTRNGRASSAHIAIASKSYSILKFMSSTCIIIMAPPFSLPKTDIAEQQELNPFPNDTHLIVDNK